MPAELELLEQKLGYVFSRRELLIRALTHKSWMYEQPHSSEFGDNEQLEFLGDSILGFLVSVSLWRAHPELAEGQLSKLRAQLVNEAHLYKVAQALSLGSFLILGRCEEMSGGRSKKALQADAVEALIAGIYLDGGLEPAGRFVQEAIVDSADVAATAGGPGFTDYKTALQELTQARHLPMPRYSTVHQRGPEHSKTFLIEARVGDELRGEAEGPSKKIAGQKAARLVLDQLRNRFDHEGQAGGPFPR